MKSLNQSVSKVYILVDIHKILVSGHFPLPINAFLHPCGHSDDQVLQELVLLCPLQPNLQDRLLLMLKVGAVVVPQLLLHPRPKVLDWVEVRGLPGLFTNLMWGRLLESG